MRAQDCLATKRFQFIGRLALISLSQERWQSRVSPGSRPIFGSTWT